MMVHFLPLAQTTQATQPTMPLTTAGMTIMVASITLVLGLTFFCFWRILREPSPSTHHHAPLETDTQDDT